MAQKFVRVVSWDKYQHYKNRNPPWVKLYRELLTSRMWTTCDDATRVLAISCMLLAAETGNQIPLDVDYFRRRAFLSGEIMLAKLVDAQFIEIVEANPTVAEPASKNSAKSNSNTRSNTRDRVRVIQRQSALATEKHLLAHEKATGVKTESIPLSKTNDVLAEKDGAPLSGHFRHVENRKVENVPAPSDVLVETIARSHPANWRSKGAMIIPNVHCSAIIAALQRDGAKVVTEGTNAYAAAVRRWPISEQRMVVGVVKFYNESHYLKDPRLWERTNGQTKQIERTQRNRETIIAAIRENRRETAGPSSADAGKRNHQR